MTMNRGAVIILSKKPILNPDRIEQFENLDVNYSIYLNSLLYQNWVELIATSANNYNTYYCLNVLDTDFIQNYFTIEASRIILLNADNQHQVSDFYKELVNEKTSKFLFVLYNSIGIKNEDFDKALKLLSVDDRAMVIGQSEHQSLAFVGTNKMTSDLYNEILTGPDNFNVFLNKISKEDIFIYTLDNFLSINNFKDVKKLYIELSKKDSLSFCSESMHERFNDLFVEYKELLNE